MCYRTDAYATAFFRSNRYIPTASGTKYSGSTLRPSCGGRREREREREGDDPRFRLSHCPAGRSTGRSTHLDTSIMRPGEQRQAIRSKRKRRNRVLVSTEGLHHGVGSAVPHVD